MMEDGKDHRSPGRADADPAGERGRLLAIDLGSRRLGLAVSDPERRIATSLGAIAWKGRAQTVAAIGRLAREREVVGIVVGLPLHLDGRESPGSARSREFAAALESELGLRVWLVDESLSTRAAEEVLIAAEVSRKKRKRVIDGLAAVMILQSYLNELQETRPGASSERGEPDR